jgi:hypothetical protein
VKRHLLLGMTLLVAVPHWDHPLHTTLTEITRQGPTITITLRGFVDDLTRAAIGHPSRSIRAAGVDSSIARYVARNLIVGETGGARVSLAWVAVRHQADVAWFTYTARLHEPGEFRMGNSVLCELYDDQVNIVQMIQGAARKSLLFSPGDDLKPVP